MQQISIEDDILLMQKDIAYSMWYFLGVRESNSLLKNFLYELFRIL